MYYVLETWTSRYPGASNKEGKDLSDEWDLKSEWYLGAASQSTLASSTGGERSIDCRPLDPAMRATPEVVRRASVLG